MQYLHLDEPFLEVVELDDADIDVVVEEIDVLAGRDRIARLMCPSTPTAFTPVGLEIIVGTECEEQTVSYPDGFVQALIADTHPHQHATVRAMNAVKAALRKVIE